MQIQIPNPVAHILTALESSGFEAYVVGGCVRDSLLGLEPKDWDIATDAKPKQIIEIFKSDSSFKILTTGARFGTISLYHIQNKHIFEITTFRIDSHYSNHRHPDYITFTSHLKDDLKRRDFSINALAFSPTSQKIHDHHNGINDLKNHLICCIGDANTRFCEDGLRILRALRFQANLGFEIATHTKQAILTNKSLLSKIAKERIQSELNKLILGDYIKKVFFEFYEVFGVIFRFCDENLLRDKRLKLRAMCDSIESAPKELSIRLGLFFSFMAQALELDGHSSLSFAKENLENLRYQKTLINQILLLMRYTPPSPDKIALKKLASTIGIANLKLLIRFWEAKDSIQNLKPILQEIINNDECFCVKNLAINGDDIKCLANDMGYEINGKDIGIILQNLLDSVIQEEILNHKQALQKHLKNLLKSKK